MPEAWELLISGPEDADRSAKRELNETSSRTRPTMQSGCSPSTSIPSLPQGLRRSARGVRQPHVGRPRGEG